MQSDTLFLQAVVCLVAMLGDAHVGWVLKDAYAAIRRQYGRDSFGSGTRGSKWDCVSVGKARYWVDKRSRSSLTDTPFVAGSCLE